jgi:broad specificity phosphatase PhoE
VTELAQPQPLVVHPRTVIQKEATGLAPHEVGAGGTFWFCRHAEVHNPQQVLYGRLPRFGLTASGKEVATNLGRFLSRQPLEKLYVSPLLRARQTAQAITSVNPQLKPRRDRDLLEVHTSYDGVPLAQIGDFNFYEPLAHPADETIEMVLERVLHFVKGAVTRHKRHHFAAVSHGDPVVILHAFYLGLPMQLASLRAPNFYPERASVTRYDFPPEGFTSDATRVRVSYYEPPFPE